MVSAMGGELNPELESNLDHISENIIFFDEHTCGADESVKSPIFREFNQTMAAEGSICLGSS